MGCESDRQIDSTEPDSGSRGERREAVTPATGCADPHHRDWNRGELDLLPDLEPAWRAQLSRAVAHAGLIGALRRVSGDGREPTTGGLR
jgi:hypothetical protein